MKLLVIDGNSVINRAFYGIKLLTTKSGQYTNALTGFLNILLRLKSMTDPTHICVAFDVKKKTFRHEMYDEYKAGRKPTPPELLSQIPLLKQILGFLGIKCVECPGFEADDILGTLSDAINAGDECFLATGDRDSLQLINNQEDKNVTVLLLKTQGGKPVTVSFDEALLKETYHVTPKQMIDIKALMGDSSDHLPGAKGIGEKTAIDLIERFSNIDYIYENIDTIDIKNGVRTKLKDSRENVFLTYKLGTICKSAPISLDMDEYKISPPDKKSAIRFFADLEMFSFISKFGLDEENDDAIESIDSSDENALEFIEQTDLLGLLGRLKRKKEAYFTFCTENQAVTALFFELDGKIEGVFCNNFDFDLFLTQFLESDIKKYTENTKALHSFALLHNTALTNVKMDTSLCGYVLNPGSTAFDISSLALKRGLKCRVKSVPEDLKKFAEEAGVIRPLSLILNEEIKENGEEKILFDIEIPLSEVLASMENEGFAVDKEQIEKYGEFLGERLFSLTNEIYEKAGCEFNINSPKQLGEVLFERLNIYCPKKTKNGYSTDAETLEKIENDHEIVPLILEYRTLSKLKSTYCDGLLKEIRPDGRIHSTLSQLDTRTGRISSQNPNLQNIPIRKEEGRQIRACFTAKDGYTLIDADYSQIELRVLSSIAKDENMLSAFKNGEDIHKKTASEVFGLPSELVTKSLRNKAKVINFGIVYGMGAFTLAKDIGATRKEASDYIDAYFSHYSGIKAYMQKAVDDAKVQGFCTTMLGRRRMVPELKNSNKRLVAFGERVARNMPIQGTAADIIKLAMIHTYERLKRDFKDSRLIMQVHDELIVEAPQEDAENVKKALKEEMENAFELLSGLVCEANIGKTWLLAH